MRNFFVLAAVLLCSHLVAQTESDNCRLAIGTNLGGLADYGTELPFVDLMHNARSWYTKDIDNPEAAFNSEQAAFLTYRTDGYPTQVPQTVSGSTFEQKVVTIWAITDGWPAGQYTILWDGSGELSFWGSFQNLEQTGTHRIVFDFMEVIDGVVEMTIEASTLEDPIHNIRVLMPGSEATYEAEPFNPIWLSKLSDFRAVRFMDWGSTNGWGQLSGFEWDDPSLFNWEDRAQPDHYSWANEKGIPYEMMIHLMNNYDLDGWVCVPHRADDEYMRQMAELFRDELEPGRHLTVEYSNEIWNWIFGQTNWVYKYGCEIPGISWPEGIVPYVQNCLDIWSEAYSGQLDRITRVAGVQASWQDVSNRIVNNLEPESFDAVSPTFYFGLTETADAQLDILGPAATAADVAFYARQGMSEAESWLMSQKTELADPLGLPLIFYEGGQHLTGHPFGEEPTYGQALLDIQRDTSMYNLYQEWFDFLETLQSGEEPLQLMNFSFIANLSSRYGSWGILETMDQDTAAVPAPKYQAILDRIAACELVNNVQELEQVDVFIGPNPSSGEVEVSAQQTIGMLVLINAQGQEVLRHSNASRQLILNLSEQPDGIYFIQLFNVDGSILYSDKIILQ